MNKLQHFFQTIFKFQTVKTSFLTILCGLAAAPLYTQTVNTVATGVVYGEYTSGGTSTHLPYSSDDINVLYCNYPSGDYTTMLSNVVASPYNKSFVTSPAPASNQNQTDPWVSSALIEYDQPYPNTTWTDNKYPNHCLGLCTQVACSNLPVGQSTYSIAFPLQRVTFDIFKYYNGKNPKNPDELPAIRSVDIYPVRDTSDPSKYTCGSYHCTNAGKDQTVEDTKVAECLGAHWICDGTSESSSAPSPVNIPSSFSCTVKENSGSIVISGQSACSVSGAPLNLQCTASGEPTRAYSATCTYTNAQGEGKTAQCTYNGSHTGSTCFFSSPGDTATIAIEYGTSSTISTLNGVCWPSTTTKEQTCPSTVTPCTFGNACTSKCYKYAGNGSEKISADIYYGCNEGAGHSDCVVFDNNGVETNKALSFCTGWDASYEIAGEFGKTNGNYGFRATVSTDVPSDGVIADRIEISETGVYPGHNGATQIPIQVDVTNVHTVRSTPSLVGTITPVSAQPYTFQYRLSKDADVRIAIFDASTKDSAAYGVSAGTKISTVTQSFCTAAGGTWSSGDSKCNVPSLTTPSECTAAGYTWAGTHCEVYSVNEKTCALANYTWENGTCYQPTSSNTSNTASFAGGGDYNAATNMIVRTLVDWQPRTGEGMKGTDKDTQISDFDSWDGRNDGGMLLPAGNYIASIQAKSQDEWKGIDFSRAVTRQVSLDPLKLTDVRVTGLNKKSTAYATISYVPTESATVYWEVYTPGTTFDQQGDDIFTRSNTITGTGPSFEERTGSLVFRNVEQKTGRMVYTDRWDGTCQPHNADGSLDPNGTCKRIYAKGEKKSDGTLCSPTSPATTCTESFAAGAPLPDGNYVYVLWAEIPYNGKYVNALAGGPAFTAGSICEGTQEINHQCFTGVKTLKYTVGTLELERGLVGISMQPASYATLGSSPTAYGLDPFVFKYALDRDAQVIATVENTAGLVVKHLTLEGGEPNVSQQLNTLTWDGRDDQGRMVYPGTYMFRVKAMDAMFPAQSNEAITVFPVDMYRVVDVATTDVYGDSNAKATISYHLSKPMNVQINIYNKDVVIPNYNGQTGDYNDYTVGAVYNAQATGIPATATTGSSLEAGKMTLTPTGGGSATNVLAIPENGSIVEYDITTIGGENFSVRNTWTSASEYKLNNSEYRGDTDKEQNTDKYTVYLKQEVISVVTDIAPVWPPHICATDDPVYGVDKPKTIFGGSASAGYYVKPSSVNKYQAACIYVNDSSFRNYPTYTQAAAGAVDVRLQPIHTFDRSHLSNGDDVVNMVEWDALYFYNPTPSGAKHTAEEIAKCTGATEKSNCPYEMLADGQYPFYLSARSDEPFNRYYFINSDIDSDVEGTYVNGAPFVRGSTLDCSGSPCAENIDVRQEKYLYASDKVVSKLNVTRGPVYFLEDSVQVYPNAPQLFNASSTTLTFIPPYEINFAISRAATVEAAVVALEPGMCSPVTDNVLSGNVNVFENRTNVAGEICKFLSTMTIVNTGTFDANVLRKLYWDGTDHNGNYVKPGMYEIRLTARNYPDAGLYQPTVKSITISADLFKVFDLLEADNYAISTRGTDMKIGYQISVPMKVAIQIFKPGTTIYDYAKGTLRNPTTGKEVKDINEVLVRSIVGIRPGTTLIEEVWDGLDYAQQEVPDGVYPFRFVTSLDSSRIDSVTGEILVTGTEQAIDYVADTYEYQNLHKATIAIGDGRFVCEDWKKTVFFYPNPLRDGKQGTLEITKMPVPGTVSIKYFNLAGDMVRNADYTCVDANNYQTTMGESLYFQPDNNVQNADGTYTRVPLISAPGTDQDGDLAIPNVRNAALRCKWNRDNQHGKKVARGVYFGLVDFKAFNGREHCQKVVKILIP